jgi:hypothetical protein
MQHSGAPNELLNESSEKISYIVLCDLVTLYSGTVGNESSKVQIPKSKMTGDNNRKIFPRTSSGNILAVDIWGFKIYRSAMIWREIMRTMRTTNLHPV